MPQAQHQQCHVLQLEIRVMEQLKADRGLPYQIRVDNGPELMSAGFTD